MHDARFILSDKIIFGATPFTVHRARDPLAVAWFIVAVNIYAVDGKTRRVAVTDRPFFKYRKIIPFGTHADASASPSLVSFRDVVRIAAPAHRRPTAIKLILIDKPVSIFSFCTTWSAFLTAKSAEPTTCTDNSLSTTIAPNVILVVFRIILVANDSHKNE
jgi:hypothetical protein